MFIHAQLKNARMAPRKVRLVRSAVIGLPVREARAQLTWQQSKAADLVLRVLNSAVANARHNFEFAEDNLKVADVIASDGIVFKRFQPASRGAAHPFVKRTSHITVVVSEIVAAKGAPQARKSEIDTVTIEELAKREDAEKNERLPAGGEEAGEAQVAGNEAGPKGGEGEAYGKMKMQQRGSGARKAYRRKSI